MDNNATQQPHSAAPDMNPAAHVPQAQPQMPVGHPPQQVSSQAGAQPSSSAATMHMISDKISQLLILFYFFIASVLLLRFAFSLFGANRSTPFADFVYSITAPFMLLFEGMFGGGVGVGNYILEVEIFVALIVYALIFFGIARLVKIIFK